MDYQKFVEQAIGMLEAEKVGLINLGTRAGSIATGTNGAGRIQHHWVLDAKQRRYIPKKTKIRISEVTPSRKGG